ncbi:Blue-light-activated protein [Pseudooceanicola marinus]|uniref:histidine kinase n=1 Tax=Pseudooceanicola marinus TaxID=396013 RepID=A0A1X6YRW9_9RHOB|nr:transporter substrate-binding domain-containing protein [Pseudooceanicola marinus]PJE29607.1 hypothetical protein CVM50_14035 [Pseudooceanicola marinus]SLN28722.1 Blue-light-activated protein [Pseudooceanicola marinus]
MSQNAKLLSLTIRMLAISAAFVMFSPTGKAQTVDTLVVPWTEWPGSYELDERGRLTGFYAELARSIAKEAGYSIRFVEYATAQSALVAQRTGVSDILAGVMRSPSLAGNDFSEPVGRTSVYLFVREEDGSPSSVGQMVGATIGVISETSGSRYGRLNGHAAEVIEFPDARLAFGALILGRVDGVVTTYNLAADLLEDTKLDYRVRRVSPPLAKADMHVAISPLSKISLDDVNGAIERLQQAGKIDELISSWNIEPPAPAPSVLTVGVADFPPYQFVEAGGEFTGFGVEALRELARRANLSIDFKKITLEEWALGPNSGIYDILPPLSVTDARSSHMQFGLSLQESSYSIFVLSEKQGVNDLDDLVAARVGLVGTNWAYQSVDEEKLGERIVFDDPRSMAGALVRGEVEAVLYETSAFSEILSELGLERDVQKVEPPFGTSRRAIAFRDGLATVREKINSVTPGYLSSDEYQKLKSDWLGAPHFWTPDRVRFFVFVSALLVVLVLVSLLFVLGVGRRNARRASKRSDDLNSRLTAILETASCGVLAINRDGAIAEANSSAMKILGINADEVEWPLAWPSSVKFLDPKEGGALDFSASPINRARAGVLLRAERVVLQSSGAEDLVHVNVSSTPVHSRLRTELSAVVVLDDVTEQELARINEQRATRLDALGQLTGGIAHDFNNILGTVDYSIALIERGATDEQKRFIHVCSLAVRRGSELTRRLLTFARESVGVVKTVQVSSAFEDLKALVRPAVESSIDVLFSAGIKNTALRCDPSQFENVILNLCLNSRNAIIESGVGTTISVTADFKDGQVAIVVADDGPGMSKSVLSKAVNPFFSTRKNVGGTGLGLAMAQGFTEQIGGRMEIDSSVGVGTSVQLFLPAFISDADPEGETGPEITFGSGQSVLLVEDQDSLREVAAGVLKGLGYNVFQAHNGESALSEIRSGLKVDLLLTDIVMPGEIGGYELADIVRKMVPSIGVLYMSGYTGDEATHYPLYGERIGKPCSPGELSQAVARALSAS